jgi:putative peptidoglycan lipid II flippase
MIKKLALKFNKNMTMVYAAAMLAASGIFSSLLGLLRERLILANFGLGAELDAYRTAFTIPDFMFFLLVSGSLSVSFIPVFNERIAKGNKRSAWELSSSLINILAIVTTIASILIIIFAEPLVSRIVAPGLDEHATFLAVSMMRIIAINPILFSISSVLTSIQQAHGKFFFYALTPSIYSLGIISGVLFLAPKFGIMGVAYGVVLGSFFQLITSILGLAGLKFNYAPWIYTKNKGLQKVLKVLPTRSLDQGMDYLNVLVETNMASRLGAGMITAYQTAFTLQTVPVNLVGAAISTAAFPKMTERLSQNRPDLFKKEVQNIIKVIIWLIIPTMIVTYFGRGYLVRLLLANGSAVVASVLGLLVGLIGAKVLFQIITRIYYAKQDTMTPLYISFFAVGLNVFLAATLGRASSMGVQGLAIAQTVSSTVEVLILMRFLRKHVDHLFDKDVIAQVSKMLIAGVFTGFITWGMIKLLPLRSTDVGFMVIVPKFLITVGVSLGSYVIISYIIGLKEAKPVIEKLFKFIGQK